MPFLVYTSLFLVLSSNNVSVSGAHFNFVSIRSVMSSRIISCCKKSMSVLISNPIIIASRAVSDCKYCH